MKLQCDKSQFVVLKIQLNNPSKNRCYMGANKPCNSGFPLPFFLWLIGVPIFFDFLRIRMSEYYGAAEPPVRCGESHLSGLTEPPIDSYSA